MSIEDDIKTAKAVGNENAALLRRLAHAVEEAIKTERTIQQILGQALHYPRFKDDQENFPGATDEDGVCVGEHIAETLAQEAATNIARMDDQLDEAAIEISKIHDFDVAEEGSTDIVVCVTDHLKDDEECQMVRYTRVL